MAYKLLILPLDVNFHAPTLTLPDRDSMLQNHDFLTALGTMIRGDVDAILVGAIHNHWSILSTIGARQVSLIGVRRLSRCA